MKYVIGVVLVLTIALAGGAFFAGRAMLHRDTIIQEQKEYIDTKRSVEDAISTIPTIDTARERLQSRKDSRNK